MTPNEEKPPRRIASYAGVSFCLISIANRLSGASGTLGLFNELVVNVISNDAGNHTDDKRRDGTYHL